MNLFSLTDFEDSPGRQRVMLCCAILLSYASIWQNTFVFDDAPLIVRNEFLKHWDKIPDLLTRLNFEGAGIGGGFYRPLPMLLHFFIYQAFGPAPAVFHALNLSLQVLNACLLHHFGIRAGFKKSVAFAAALLWAVHPLHTEAVAYMSSTPELLWSTFCLLGLIALLPDFTPLKIGKAMIFFMLTLACKESAVVFPALAAVTLFLTDKNRPPLPAYLKIWPLFLLSAVYIGVHLIFLSKSELGMQDAVNPEFFRDYTSNFFNRLLTCLATLPVYARLIFWPTGLHMERLFPVFTTVLKWQPATGLMIVALFVFQILQGRASALTFGLLWFAVAQSPNTGIALPINALISEHWMYVPTMGLFLGGVQTAADALGKKRDASIIVLFLLAFILGCATFRQTQTWRNPETFYQNVFQNGGDVSRLRDLLGVFYMEQRQFDKAADEFRDVISHPSKNATPLWTAETHINLAMALLQVQANEGYDVSIDEVNRVLPSSPYIPEAIAELGKALQADPEGDWGHIVLAAIYRYQGNKPMAAFHENQAGNIRQKRGH